MSTGKVLLGLLVGATAGAMAGILFAPEKGSKTRKRILKQGENYVEAAKEKFDELLDVVTEKVEKVKDEISNLNGKKVAEPQKTK